MAHGLASGAPGGRGAPTRWLVSSTMAPFSIRYFRVGTAALRWGEGRGAGEGEGEGGAGRGAGAGARGREAATPRRRCLPPPAPPGPATGWAPT